MDSELHLAVAVVEWQVAIDHLEAMRETGVPVPYVIQGRIEIEQRRLIQRYKAVRGDATAPEQDVELTVEECRALITERQEEVDELNE